MSLVVRDLGLPLLGPGPAPGTGKSGGPLNLVVHDPGLFSLGPGPGPNTGPGSGALVPVVRDPGLCLTGLLAGWSPVRSTTSTAPEDTVAVFLCRRAAFVGGDLDAGSGSGSVVLGCFLFAFVVGVFVFVFLFGFVARCGGGGAVRDGGFGAICRLLLARVVTAIFFSVWGC